MAWNINQPGSSNWTNNATDSSVGVTALKVGSSDIQGYRVNDNKKMFFGTDSDFSLRYAPTFYSFKLDYISDGITTSIFEYNHKTDKTTIRNLELQNLVVKKVDANTQGFPSITASDGKIVYTEDSNLKGKFYLGLGDGQGASPTP